MKSIVLTGIMVLGLLPHALGEGAAAAAIPEAAPKKSPPWDVTATLGATVTRGNSSTLLVSGNVLATKKWQQNELDLGVDGVYGEDKGVKNSEMYHGFGQYNRLFTERFFGYLRLEGLHDGIADIDYRITVSPGAGYYLIKQTNLFLRTELGPGYVFEKLAGKTDDYATLRVAERLEWKINERSKLWQSLEYLPQVDDFENYVVNAEIGVDTAITKKLSLTAFLQDSYRSQPAPGRLHNDLKLVAGLKYKIL